jgi:hypothetical protein
LQDLARVDSALARLPRIEASFLSGALSWSKARLLCRAAEPEDEARWVAFAQRVPVRVIAREVRAVDRGSLEAGAFEADDEEDPDAQPREGIVIHCTPEVPAKWWRVRQVSRRVTGERLAPWACMEAVVGEVLSSLPRAVAVEELVDADPTANVCAAHASDAGTMSGRTMSCGKDPTPEEASTTANEEPVALPVFLRSLIDDIDEADPFELDARLRRVVAIEQRIWAEVGALLARIAAERSYLALGHRNLESYARERLGISPRKARALLRLERAGEVCPALASAYREGRISWVQAHALVPILLLEHAFPWREAWIERASRVSVRRLEDDVDRALALEEIEPPGDDLPTDRPDRQTCAKSTERGTPPDPFGPARFFFSAPRDVARLVRATICSVRRLIEERSGRLPSGGEAVEAMLDHVLEAWGANDPRAPRSAPGTTCAASSAPPGSRPGGSRAGTAQPARASTSTVAVATAGASWST